VRFIEDDWSPRCSLDSLTGVFRHLTGAWPMRGTPNIVLVHYDDLVKDLEGEMRRLAGPLSITVPEERWPVLVRASTFGEMRARADTLVSDPLAPSKTATPSSAVAPRATAGTADTRRTSALSDASGEPGTR
jgi:hypothetical protein